MPDETVKDGKTVLAKSDYDISWPAGCVDPGKYSVTVTLKGNYSGTATLLSSFSDYLHQDRRILSYHLSDGREVLGFLVFSID